MFLLINLGFWEPFELYATKNDDFLSLVSLILWKFPEQAVSMTSVIDHRCRWPNACTQRAWKWLCLLINKSKIIINFVNTECKVILTLWRKLVLTSFILNLLWSAVNDYFNCTLHKVLFKAYSCWQSDRPKQLVHWTVMIFDWQKHILNS